MMNEAENYHQFVKNCLKQAEVDYKEEDVWQKVMQTQTQIL